MNIHELPVANLEAKVKQAHEMEKKERQSRRYKSNSYSVYTPENTDQSPEKQYQELRHTLATLPGSAKYYRDEDTGNIFAFARYNTF